MIVVVKCIKCGDEFENILAVRTRSAKKFCKYCICLKNREYDRNRLIRRKEGIQMACGAKKPVVKAKKLVKKSK